MSEPASPNDFGLFDWIDFTSPDEVQSLFRQRANAGVRRCGRLYAYHLAEHP